MLVRSESRAHDLPRDNPGHNQVSHRCTVKFLSIFVQLDNASANRPYQSVNLHANLAPLRQLMSQAPQFTIWVTFRFERNVTLPEKANHFKFIKLWNSPFCMPGGYSIAAYILLTEFVGIRHRSTAGCSIWYSYNLSTMALAGLAYLVRDWRKLSIIMGAPAILFLLGWL